MFDQLSEKFSTIFSKIAGQKTISEKNISDAIRQVRLALLDADVNYSVAKSFIQRVKEKALGQDVLKTIKASEQFIELLHGELCEFLGGDQIELSLDHFPATMMLVGLQGAGKTTQAAKLAHLLTKSEYGKKPLLVACDLARPAAIEQLRVLGEQINVPVYAEVGAKKPVAVAKAALKEAKKLGCDLVIFDTAGRLHVDEALMKELEDLKRVVAPQELLFVANSATGQDAVATAKEFHERLGITGTILTMLDSDARGGAALSIYSVTGRPIKFEGIGEKIDDFQLFSAESMADRVLGMGDTINLVKRAKEHISEEESAELEEKIKKASFTFEDYLKQMQAVKKMGSLKGLMKMMPKQFQMPDMDSRQQEFTQMEAIILSMTLQERKAQVELTMGRMKRIARGSGTNVGEVNKLKKSYLNAKKFFKSKPNQNKLEKLMGGK